MSRFKPTLLTCLLSLPGALFAASPAEDTVRLPDMTVNEQQASNQPTVVSTETNAPASEAFTDLARQTAGLSVNDGGGRGFGETVTLRGLSNTPFFSDASAPVYLDNIPLASVFTFPTELYDYSQMNVYRGPQANALFGRAGDAGVIQFTSAAAGDKATAHFGITIGDYNAHTFTAAAQTARTDQFDASIHLGSSQRDGYIENTQLHTDVDYKHALFGRIGLHYRPAKDLEISLNVLGQQSNDGAQALVPLGGPDYTVSRGKEGVSDADFGAVALGIAKKFTDSTLTATTSVSDWNLSPYSNRLVVFGGVNFDSVLNQSQHAFNEELRYTSDYVTGGAFFSHSKTEGGASRTFSGFTIEDSDFKLSSDSFALFGQANLKPADGWLVTPGLRLEHDAKDFTTWKGCPQTRSSNRTTAGTPYCPASRSRVI